jgi:hypothetical protein
MAAVIAVPEELNTVNGISPRLTKGVAYDPVKFVPSITNSPDAPTAAFLMVSCFSSGVGILP